MPAPASRAPRPRRAPPASPPGAPDADGRDAAATLARVLTDVAERAGLADLRWLVAGYEGAQRERLALGEQIRAVVQGRAAGTAVVPNADAGALLVRIRAGDAVGPAPALAALYRRLWEEERAVGAAMEAVVTRHPAWPWLEQVRGVGRTLSARLLARLDVRRAPYPSSFWSYCGLATVPDAAAAGTAGPRRAPPRARRGEPRAYDAGARVLCHLIGVSILRRGGAYKAYHRAARAALDDAHPDWPAGRRHLAALRRTEKLFLVHLWLVWREREGLTVGARHADAPADARAAPWAMAG